MTLTGTVSLTVVIYLRVSTEEQAKKGFSLPEQSEACQRKARELAAEAQRNSGQKVDLELKIFQDDFGGDILDRPVLEEMRAWIRNVHPAYFVCMDPDRFSRSLKLQLIVADEIEGQGTRLSFVQTEYDPSDISSRAFFQFKGLMAEMEKAKIIERTSRGKRGKLKAGGRSNGAAPYGYHQNKATDQLEIDEEQAKWVRQMYEWVAVDGLGIIEVGQRLNDLGVQTRRGKGKWYRSVVRSVLHNRTYMGQMVCNRKDFRGLFAVHRLPRSKRVTLTPKQRPEDEWVTVPVPAIIDQATYNRVQARLRNTTRRGRHKNTGLLSFLAHCGECGAAMVYARHSAGRTYLRCRNKYPVQLDIANPPAKCDTPHHRAARIEQEVWNALVEILSNPTNEVVARYAEKRDVGGTVSVQIAHLTEEKAALERQLTAKLDEQRQILQHQFRGNLSPEIAEPMLQEAAQAVEHIKSQSRDMDRRLSELQRRSGAGTLDHLRSISAKVQENRKALSDLSDENKRRFLLEAFESILVYHDGTWKARGRTV